MEEIILEYNVAKLQLNPFAEDTKDLLSEILRFERLLLENSTNRKTFSSYDVGLITITLCSPSMTNSFSALKWFIVYFRSGYPRLGTEFAASSFAAIFSPARSLSCA
jgi:hypothetical protein